MENKVRETQSSPNILLAFLGRVEHGFDKWNETYGLQI